MAETKSDEASSSVLTDGTVVLSGQRGSARMSRLAPGVVLYVCKGYFPLLYADPMMAYADNEIKANKALVMATDAWELGSIEAGYREAWTEWFKRHKQHFRMELLVRSKLMEMAASLANLFTGLSVVKTHSSVASWEAAVQRAAPGFRRQKLATSDAG